MNQPKIAGLKNMNNNPSPTSPWVKAVFVALMSFCALKFSGQEARKILSNPQPAYPELARRMSLEGVVKVELIVGADGEIKDSKVLGGHPILVDATLKALRNWKYERAHTESKIQLEFKFKS
jgi:TonB family protein